MPIVNITLEDILRARDARADAQRRLLRTYRLPLVSFTMNIAGPVKFSPLIELAFDAGLEALRTALGQPVAAEVIRPATGCEALLVYDRPAAALKAAQKLGLRVPEDLAVVGHNDCFLTRVCTPTLTSIDSRGEFLAQTAAENLVRFFEGKPFEKKVRADWKLVRRESF